MAVRTSVTTAVVMAAASVAYGACTACSGPREAQGIDASPRGPRDAAGFDAQPTDLDWTWAFTDGGGCHDGVDRVQIYTAEWNTDDVEFRGAPSDPTTIPCVYGAGGVEVAPTGEYDSWIQMMTTDNRVFAVTGPAHVDLGTTASTAIDVPRGWVHVAWSLFGGMSGHALACADIPSLNGSGMGAIELFPGASGQATPLDTEACQHDDTWLALPAGTYDLTLRAVYGQTYLPAGGPDIYNLGAATFTAQTVTPGATLELGTQQLVLTQY